MQFFYNIKGNSNHPEVFNSGALEKILQHKQVFLTLFMTRLLQNFCLSFWNHSKFNCWCAWNLLLHRSPRRLELKIISWWQDIFIQGFLLDNTISALINNSKLIKSQRSKTAADNNTTTSRMTFLQKDILLKQISFLHQFFFVSLFFADLKQTFLAFLDSSCLTLGVSWFGYG